MGAIIHLRDLAILDFTLTAQPRLTVMDRACLPAVSEEIIVHRYQRPDVNVEGREIYPSNTLVRKLNTRENLQMSIVWPGISESITSSAQLHV